MNNPLLDLTSEELIKVEVTTASRHLEKLTEIASAIFAITQDDLKRSGATNIPEALRMASSLEVARIGTNIGANMGGIITVINDGKNLNIAVDLKCIQHAGFKLITQSL